MYYSQLNALLSDIFAKEKKKKQKDQKKKLEKI